MAYPDLQTMFNNGMGSLAAIQTGQMQAQAEQEQAAKAKMQEQLLQEQILKNQQTQAMNPLDQQFRQGQVAQQAAQLPGIQAASEQEQIKAKTARETAASQILAEISKNKAQITSDDLKTMDSDAKKISQAAVLLEQTPVMMRQEALGKIAQQYGVGTDNPMIKQFMQVDPQVLPSALRSFGEGMALASQQYIQESAKQKDKQAFEAGQNELDRKNRSAIAGGNNATSLEIARMNNTTRENVAEKVAQARMAGANNKLSIDQRISALEVIPDDQKTDDDRRALQALKTQQLQARAAGANPTTGQVLGIDTPQAIAARGGATGGQPVVTPQSGDAQLAAAMKAQGMPYEPDKYVYRVGPNGQIQRKVK